MAMTLTQGRALVQKYADDADAKEHTATDGGDIDLALDGAIARTMRELAEKGVTQLMETVSDTATGGVLDLSAYDPLSVESVSMQVDSNTTVFEEIAQVHRGQRGVQHTADSTLSMLIHRRLTVPDAAGDVLIGYDVASVWTAANSTTEIERLVCVRAARELLAVEGEEGALRELEQQYMTAVLAGVGPGKSFDFPTAPEYYGDIGWTWEPSEQKVSTWYRR